MFVKDKMSKNIICARLDSNIQDIAKLMKKYDIGFIPIHENNKIVGIITDRDIVINNVFNNDEKIKDYITKNIIIINENENIKSALELMKKHKIKRLIVTKSNKVTGILSLSDILSDTNGNVLLDTLKEIYSIDKNEHDYNLAIDEFYL